MRRMERECRENLEIDDIIKKCECLRLGLWDEKCPYILPLNFGYERTELGSVFYFHGADKGKKNELLRSLEYAGFELDRVLQIVEDEKACKFTCKFESIVGMGRIQIVEDANEKTHALNCIMSQYSDRSEWYYPEGMINKIFIFKLLVEEMTCKLNR